MANIHEHNVQNIVKAIQNYGKTCENRFKNVGIQLWIPDYKIQPPRNNRFYYCVKR